MAPKERLTILWRSSVEAPEQGLRLRLVGGKLRVHGEILREIVLWRSTAPSVVEVECVASKPTESRLWNCWRDEQGVMQAWIRNAGLVVDELDANHVRLACNARTELSFKDLILDLTFSSEPC